METKKYEDYLNKKEQEIKNKEGLSEKKQQVLLVIKKTEDIIDDINLNEIENSELKQNFLQYFSILDKNLDLLLDDNKKNDNLQSLEYSFNKFSKSFSKYSQKYNWNIDKLEWYILWVKEGIKKAWEFVYEDIKAIIEFLTSWENISKLPSLIWNILNNFDKILESLWEEAKKELNNLKLNFQSLNELSNNHKISDKLYNYKISSIWISMVLIIAYEFIPISKIKLKKDIDKSIVYKKLSDNFPLLWVNRLKKWDVIYNLSFWWIKKINDTYWQKTTDEILYLIKKEIKQWITNWNRTIRDNYKNLTFTLNNKNIEDILWTSKKEFIKNILEKNKNDLQNKIHWDYNKFEQDILNELSIWIWKAEVSAIGSHAFTVSDASWDIEVTNTDILFRLYTESSGATGISTSTTPSLNTWYHIVAIYDTTSGMSLYVNNVLIGTNTYTAGFDEQGHTTVGLGAYNQYDNRKGFNGLIDQTRIFNRALTDNEVKTFYEEWR